MPVDVACAGAALSGGDPCPQSRQASRAVAGRAGSCRVDPPHRRLPWLVPLALIAVFLAFAANADERVLRFSSSSPAGSRNSIFFNQWAERINRASAGTLRIEVRDGPALANFANVYERVSTDVVQIGWAIHQAVAGTFPLTELLSLPQPTDDWVAASAAFWRLYETGLLDDEFDEIVPLALFFFGPAQIHFAHEQQGPLHDLRGRKIGVVARFPSELVSRLGGTPVSMPPGRAYEMLHHGTVDGVAFSWAGVAAYELQEVASFHLEAPVGGGTGMIFMAKSLYETLPPEARQALAVYSGEQASREFARHFQSEWLARRAEIAELNDHRIISLSAQELEFWRRDGVSPVVEEWSSVQPGGRQLLETFRDLLAGLGALR